MIIIAIGAAMPTERRERGTPQSPTCSVEKIDLVMVLLIERQDLEGWKVEVTDQNRKFQ
jgi:hypothetical protein